MPRTCALEGCEAVLKRSNQRYCCSAHRVKAFRLAPESVTQAPQSVSQAPETVSGPHIQEPAPEYMAATVIDHLGRPEAFIPAVSEEARKHWDARCWEPGR